MSGTSRMQDTHLLPRGPGARRGDRGFTLLELMIGAGLLAIVVGVSTVYLAAMTDAVAYEMSQSALEMNAARTLNTIADDIVDGRVFTIGPDEEDEPVEMSADFALSRVAFRQPVDLGGDVGLLDEYASDPFDIWGVRAPGKTGTPFLSQ